ncbi:MAG: hypothetical protein ABJB12_12175 [Pseudomonadota bacterium]
MTDTSSRGPLSGWSRAAPVCLLTLGLCACSNTGGGGRAGGSAGSGGSAAGASGAAGMLAGGGGSGPASAGSGAQAGSGAGGVAALGGEGGAAVVGAAGSGGAAGTAGGLSAGGAGSRDLSTDRALFQGPSRCAQANVQLCEDFESGTLDTATWTPLGSKPVIDGVQKMRGTKALHLTISGNGQTAIRESKTFPALNNTYYGRVFVYFGSLPTPNGLSYSHWSIIAATGTKVGGEIRVSGQMQDGVNLWGVGTDSTASGAGTGDWTNADADPNGAPLAIPIGQWLCLEWLHKGDTNETRFWWDGVEHPSLYTQPSTPHLGNAEQPYILPQFQQVWLGWQEYQSTSQKFELWLDEIAIDKARIGCVI